MLMLKCSGRAHASVCCLRPAVRLVRVCRRPRWRLLGLLAHLPWQQVPTSGQLCLRHLRAAAASQCGPFVGAVPATWERVYVRVCVCWQCCCLAGRLRDAHKQMPPVLSLGLLLGSVFANICNFANLQLQSKGVPLQHSVFRADAQHSEAIVEGRVGLPGKHWTG